MDPNASELLPMLERATAESDDASVRNLATQHVRQRKPRFRNNQRKQHALRPAHRHWPERHGPAMAAKLAPLRARAPAAHQSHSHGLHHPLCAVR